jgi:hypothetical protein
VSPTGSDGDKRFGVADLSLQIFLFAGQSFSVQNLFAFFVFAGISP